MARLPTAIIKKYGISKKAWRVFQGEDSKVGKKVMAKRRYTRRPRGRWSRWRHRKDKAFPIAATAGLIAIPFAHGTYSIFNRAQNALAGSDTWDAVGRQAVLNLTGYSLWDGKFYQNYPLGTYTPLIIGGLISKFVGGWPLNMNKYIPKMVRKYVKI